VRPDLTAGHGVLLADRLSKTNLKSEQAIRRLGDTMTIGHGDHSGYLYSTLRSYFPRTETTGYYHTMGKRAGHSPTPQVKDRLLERRQFCLYPHTTGKDSVFTLIHKPAGR
jgi:hypothetical protein